MTNGSLDPTGGQDFRALLGTKNLMAGPGMTASDTNGNTVVSVDTSLVSLRVALPASSTSACQAGSWSFDSNYFYVCVATNTWRRSRSRHGKTNRSCLRRDCILRERRDDQSHCPWEDVDAGGVYL